METLPHAYNGTNTLATQAYVAAENIESFSPAALIMVAASAVIVIVAASTGAPPFRLLALIPAAASVRIFFIVAKWFRVYGKCRFEDADFVAARRKVKRSLWLWRAAIVTQILGVFVPI